MSRFQEFTGQICHARQRDERGFVFIRHDDDSNRRTFLHERDWDTSSGEWSGLTMGVKVRFQLSTDRHGRTQAICARRADA